MAGGMRGTGQRERSLGSSVAVERREESAHTRDATRGAADSDEERARAETVWLGQCEQVSSLAGWLAAG